MQNLPNNKRPLEKEQAQSAYSDEGFGLNSDACRHTEGKNKKGGHADTQILTT